MITKQKTKTKTKTKTKQNKTKQTDNIYKTLAGTSQQLSSQLPRVLVPGCDAASAEFVLALGLAFFKCFSSGFAGPSKKYPISPFH